MMNDEARVLDATAVRPFGIMSITRSHSNEGRSRHWTLTRSRCRWQPGRWSGVWGSCRWSYSYYGYHVYRRASHWEYRRCPSIPQDVPRMLSVSSRRVVAHWPRTRGRWSARFRQGGSSLPWAEVAEREPRRGNHRNKTRTMWANPAEALKYTEALNAPWQLSLQQYRGRALDRLREKQSHFSHTFYALVLRTNVKGENRSARSTTGFFAGTLRSEHAIVTA